jgi:hypothetical protein
MGQSQWMFHKRGSLSSFATQEKKPQNDNKPLLSFRATQEKNKKTQNTTMSWEAHHHL